MFDYIYTQQHHRLRSWKQHILQPYRQAQNNQDMMNYNKAMSEVRVTGMAFWEYQKLL